MLALRWHGRRDVRIDDVELRLDLAPGMIEVEVAYCGICGSDLAEYAFGPFAIRTTPHRLTGQAPPLTLGHELSGRVVAVGPDVTAVRIGDRVSADACWRCERCEACRSGLYNRCTEGGSIGLSSDGAFASRVRFPAYCAVKLPDVVSDRAGAVLEPLAVGLHALDRGGARAGQSVIVLGFGPIGAATAAVASAMGLRAIVSEPHLGRRHRAQQLGHETFAPEGTARDIARAARERTDGGAHLVIECSGVAAALAAAPDMTRRGGNIVVVGLPKELVDLDIARLVLYERGLIGTLGYANDLPRVAEMIAQGTIDAESLVTRVVPLDQAPAVFEQLSTDPGADIKVLVEPRAA